MHRSRFTFYKLLSNAVRLGIPLGLLGFASGCASRSTHPELNLISESQYFRLIERATQRTEKYEGLMNTLNAQATLLGREVRLAQVDQRARLMLTPLEDYQNEKRTTELELNQETHIHLSFFVPDRKFNNLQNSKSNWSIFLDTPQGRVQPKKIHRLKWNFAEARQVYPHHTRWHTSYLLVFPVPTTQVEGQNLKLMITGPLAQAQFTW